LDYLLQERYDKAYKFIFDEKLETKLSQLDARLKFWIAKVFLENGFKIRAHQIFKDLINPKSLSYYSIIAKKELSEIDRAESEKILASLYQSQTNKLDSVDFTQKEIKALRRYKVFRSIQATHYAYNQLTNLTKSVDFIANPDALKPQADFYFSLIQFLNQEDDFLTSFKIMMSALRKEYFVLDESLLTMLFPKDYLKTIQRHAAKTNPILFLSLIRQESAFNPSAKSRVGARGLMQIMPRTARQFQRRLRASSLNRPSVNLKIGIKYFERLNKKYDGNLIHILSAYNAGEGRVKRWKRNVFKSEDPLLDIESIPFNETQNYVKLIYRNIFFYQYLNNSKKTLSDIDDSFKIQHYAKSI
jgi:soluble lytic murein transglycosylase